MKNKRLALMVAAAWLIAAPCAFAGETNSPGDDLKELIGRISGKLQQQKSSEADLAGELKGFDTLMTKHKGSDGEALAEVLFMKGVVYLQVLRQPLNTVSTFKQITNDFPNTIVARRAEEILRELTRQIEAEKLQASLVPGAVFPDFNEKDLQGKPLSVSNYKGKVVLVDFWATWCGPCVMELPQVLETYSKHHAQGFEIIGVSLDVDKARLENFIKDRKLNWPQFFDGQQWKNKLALNYGIMAIPKAFLLDREGKIIAVNLRGSELEEAVAAALKKK